MKTKEYLLKEIKKIKEKYFPYTYKDINKVRDNIQPLQVWSSFDKERSKRRYRLVYMGNILFISFNLKDINVAGISCKRLINIQKTFSGE